MLIVPSRETYQRKPLSWGWPYIESGQRYRVRRTWVRDGLLWTPEYRLAHALVVRTSARSSGGTATTSAIDTTGANLLVVVGSMYGGTPTISDSETNTWNTAVTANTADVFIVIKYAFGSVTVGTGHTFSAGAQFASLAAFAFSGALSTDPKDQTNSANSTSITSLQTGSVTPSEGSELLIAGIGWPAGTSSESINLSFDATGTIQSYVGGESMGVGGAYLIQTSASAVNPTWSWTSSVDACAAIATFKAAAAAPPATFVKLEIRAAP